MRKLMGPPLFLASGPPSGYWRYTAASPQPHSFGDLTLPPRLLLASGPPSGLLAVHCGFAAASFLRRSDGSPTPFISVGPTVRPTGGTLRLRRSLIPSAIGRFPHATR